MTILLLAATAILAGLWLDARRRLSAERVRHETEVQLARRAWVDANTRARDALRVAAGWRAHAAELETITVVLTPREPQGDADPTAVTTPNLRADDGPGGAA